MKTKYPDGMPVEYAVFAQGESDALAQVRGRLAKRGWRFWFDHADKQPNGTYLVVGRLRKAEES